MPSGAQPVGVRPDGTLGMYPDQVLWNVYNDLDAGTHHNPAGRTAPLAVSLLLASDPEVAVALSVVLLAVCVTVLVVLRDRWWPGR